MGLLDEAEACIGLTGGSMKTLLCLYLLVLGCSFSSCQIDVCHLPMDYGPCDGSFPRYFYDVSSGKCSKFYYGGCAGNANNFKILQDCVATCSQVKTV
ncbi:trypsin inhibitor-like [Haliotis rufescens]|uniref:trypsin inhibitor-like n=1 Tax=Haliotis rufescens TaxID=6454 RepID=UPI00201F45B5|nr:trypsin inhibitor-like [Haliotis rufescens]